MSLRRTTRLLLAPALACVGGAICAGPIEDLFSPRDWERREAAFREIKRQRQELVAELIRVLRESTAEDEPARARDPDRTDWHSNRHLAILLLREFRASAATDVLFENLTYRAPEHLSGSEWTFGKWYPAADALGRIGRPAVRPAIARLALTQDEEERLCCCWILVKALGGQLARAAVELELQREHAHKTPTHKANLEAALDLMHEMAWDEPGK